MTEICRASGHKELFDTLVVYENYPIEASAESIGGDISITDIDVHETVHYPLALQFTPGAELRLQVDYSAELFDTSMIEQLADRLRRVLEAVVADPQRRLSSIELLGQHELTRLARFSNRAVLAEPTAAVSIPVMFAAQAERTPDAVALVFEQQSWTYGELDEASTRFAHLLVDRGIGEGDIVALMLPRSGSAIVSTLGVLKAGAAYLPIDVRHPDERVGFLLADASPVAVVTDGAFAPRLIGYDVPVIDVTDPALATRPVASLPVPPESAVAYIIHTSGTTGTPKGVAVTHAGVFELISDQIARFGIGEDSRVLQFASWSFDATVFEIWVTLVTGATLVIPPDDAATRISGLSDLIDEFGVTHMTLTPSALATLPPEGLESVRSLVVAGEACPVELVDRWAPGRSMVNAYGPTEATVCATVSEPLVAGAGTPSIGRPISGTAVFVLDSGLSEVPVGVIGELYIA
ncbi:AMP-binding protein, partial [Nocardia sp. NPDC052001]|uniref:AMP-binding protein n=1 Tax=Nocardia sp. NPDC052001 TaxID=3154853 RepID=UPI0034275D08